MIDFFNEIEHHFHGKTKKDLLKIGVPNSFARIHMPQLLMGYLKNIIICRFRQCRIPVIILFSSLQAEALI